MKKQKTAILQIFYGQRGDCEKVKCSPEYKEYMDKADWCYQQLLKKLESMPEVLQLFSEYNEWKELALCEEVDANYQEGFKFGLLIGVEAGESKFE